MQAKGQCSWAALASKGLQQGPRGDSPVHFGYFMCTAPAAEQITGIFRKEGRGKLGRSFYFRLFFFFFDIFIYFFSVHNYEICMPGGTVGTVSGNF